MSDDHPSRQPGSSMRRWVFPAPPSPTGLTHRELTLTDDDVLTLSGQDLGGTSWGTSEYEFDRVLQRTETARLRAAMGIGPGDDLLAVLAARFADSVAFETFLLDQGLPGEFFSWASD